MTRKQFFKKAGLDQPKHKECFVNLIKRYNGRLSYQHLYLMARLAANLCRSWEEFSEAVENFANAEVKERKK